MKLLKLFFKRLFKLETDNEIFWRVVRENNIETQGVRNDKKYKGKRKFKKAPSIRKT